MGYGFYPGGDPRKFFPDPDMCSPEELANHQLACDAMDEGGVMDWPQGCIVVVKDGIRRYVNISSFGIGGYNDDEDEEDIE